MEQNKIALEEKAKRKEVARRRTFWFLLAFNVVLITYIFIQIIILLGGK